VELKPSASGTTIHIRFGAPETPREIELMKEIGPSYEQALRSGIPTLFSQPEAEYEARQADAGPEAELAAPRPDGTASGLWSPSLLQSRTRRIRALASC